jgi:CCR4-NOT transcriptional regulation complex NOT5 subunit
MKKIFKIEQEKLKPERAVDAIKNELRKYVKREKKKDLPNKKTMYWDFDCKFGKSSEFAKDCDFDYIFTELSGVVNAGWSECYIEVIAKAVDKPIKEESIEE